MEGGYLYDGEIPVAALTVERFKGNGNTYVITDLYFKNTSKSKNKDKYEFMGQIYGKGRLVLAVVKQYVKEHPKTTLANLNKIYSPILKNDRDSVATFLEALGIYKATGKKRHFIKPNEIIKLDDGVEVAVSSQWGIKNIGGLIKQAKAQKYKIKTIKQ